MSLSLMSEIPENQKERLSKNITFTVINRCRWIIPAVMGVLLIYIILTGILLFWGNAELRFFILDIIVFIGFGVLYFLIMRNSVDDADDISPIHYNIQNNTAALMIVFGSLVTALDTTSNLGFSPFIMTLMFVGGLMYLKPVKLLLISFLGIGIQTLVGILMNRQVVYPERLQDLLVFFIVILLMLLVNRFNVKSLVENFLFNDELEKKVEERTKQLSAETDKAQQSDNLKTVFLANMSHEIRTPLNGIIGFTELLKKNDLKQADRDKYLEIVEKSGKNLLEILNGIIEVSRIESGVCELDPGDFILNDVFSEVTDFFKGNEKITSGKILLVNKVLNNPPLTIHSDRLKIVQILINLISNSIKYSESGTITAGFELMDNKKVRIRVEDTGSGISREDLEIIFNRFQQVSTEPYNHRNGVGLGLTIVKGYTELIGGCIEVYSEPGKGSEFSIILPVDLQVR